MLEVILAWSAFIFMVSVVVDFVLLVFVEDGITLSPVTQVFYWMMWVSCGVFILTFFAMATVADVRRIREKRKAERDYGRE